MLVRLSVVVVVAWGLIAYGFLCVLHPLAGLLLASHTVVGVVALWGRHRIAAVLREVNGWLAEDIEARKLADQRADRHFVRIPKARRS